MMQEILLEMWQKLDVFISIMQLVGVILVVKWIVDGQMKKEQNMKEINDATLRMIADVQEISENIKAMKEDHQKVTEELKNRIDELEKLKVNEAKF